MAFQAAWHGSKMIFGPILMVLAVVVVLRTIAWFVKAKRGY